MTVESTLSRSKEVAGRPVSEAGGGCGQTSLADAAGVFTCIQTLN